MVRQPGGRRATGLGPGRSAVLALLVAGASALAIGGAYLVVERVPPLPAEPVLQVAAAPAPAARAAADPQAAPAPVVPSYAPPVPGVPRVVVVGDTVTSGRVAGGWPQVLCGRIGCEYLPMSVPGTGWTVPGSDGRTVADRLDDVVAAQPDVLVLAAGASDLQAGEARTRGSVNQLLYRVQRKLPATRVLVVSPFWPTAPAPAEVIAVRGWLYDASVKHGATFVNVTDLFDAEHAWMVQPGTGLPDRWGRALVADTVEPVILPLLQPTPGR